MKPVDAHCHLDFEHYEEDREEVIERAREKLEFVVNAGSNVSHNKKALKLEKSTDGFIKANLGLHPTYIDDFEQVGMIKKQIREHDPVAIGEIGLDHHHVTDEDQRDEQEKVFREMLELAEELDKPIVVHSREAEEKTVEIISQYNLNHVMLHCFNGSPDLATKAVSKGMKIGVTTQVLYSNRVNKIVNQLNIRDILLETDSPFLYRGERNNPVNVTESIEKIAEIKNISEKDIIRSTTGNAREFFL